MQQSTKTEPDLRGLILVVATGAWLGGILIAAWIHLRSLDLLIAVAAAVVLVILLWRNGQGRLIALISLSLLLGAWRYSIASPTNDPQAISTFIGPNKLQIQGTVADEPKLQGRSRLLLIAVSSVSTNGGSSWQDAHGQLEAQTLGVLIEDPYGANYGDAVELQGKLQVPPPYSPPGTFASMVFPLISVSSSGGNPIISALYHLRVTLANIIAQSLPQPEAALLVAILLGLRTPSLKPLVPLFNDTGTVHLIVPSGFKVTLLAGLVTSSTRWLYAKSTENAARLLPAQKRKANRRRWLATVLVITSIATYTLLSGAGPAAIRAGLMGILLVIAPRLGRIYNFYTALAVAALLMSIFDPFTLWDAGFQLSFLGTLGIVLLTPLFQRLFRGIERFPFGHHFAELISVTLAAQVATLPILATTFKQVSFIAPIANVLTVPLLGLLIFLGILVCATGLLFAPLGIICGWVVWPILWYFITIITWCADRPGAYLPDPQAYLGTGDLTYGLAWAYYGLLVLLASASLRKWPSLQPEQQMHSTTPSSLLSRRLWRLIQFGAALLMIGATGATALAAQPDGQLTIAFLSVGPAGQPTAGEAIFIRTPDGKTILIDGGLDVASLAQELDNRLPFWQRSLDAVILTTPKTDHLTGLQDIVSRYQIGEVIDAGILHPGASYALWRRTITERHLSYVQVRQGTSITVGTQLTLQVLWPSSPLHKSSNETLDNTLVVRLITPGLRLLLLGTTALSKFALSGLMTDLDPSYLQANIVQIVGEVGKSFPTELSSVLQAAHPSLLVITPSALSPKQRKTGDTSTILPASTLSFTEANWQVAQTAEEGTVEISSGNNGWSMNT